MTISDWIGLGLLIGNAAMVIVCLVLAVFFGWWWMLPAAVMCGLSGWLVGRELWADWR